MADREQELSSATFSDPIYVSERDGKAQFGTKGTWVGTIAIQWLPGAKESEPTLSAWDSPYSFPTTYTSNTTQTIEVGKGMWLRWGFTAYTSGTATGYFN